MAHYALERVRTLLGLKLAGKRPLSVREREVLTWAALGKSAWEIGYVAEKFPKLSFQRTRERG